jgi:DNA-binding beta-propeller fold protein YncE
MLNADSPRSASWALYRLGWYGGAGARKVMEGGALRLAQQSAPLFDASTGLVRCNWPAAFSLTLPKDALSGLYFVRVVRDDRYAVFLPLVVKDDRPADLLFQSSVTTMQAYNRWGGESLYYDGSRAVPGGFAVQVSFDRPYQGEFGAGQVLRWEQFMARFLERNGYDVSYTTNLDVSREGAPVITRRGGFLSVAHDEYWTGAQRDAVEAARGAGVSLFFFGANPAYWRVRLGDPGADGNARTLSCYKRHPENDPQAGTAEATGRFRDAPINRPEEELVGTMYEGWMLFAHPWVVANASHPVYAGTRLNEGDTIPLLVGHEYDRTFASLAPGKISRLSHSPLVDAEGKPGFAEATLYTAPSGALVFGAGTIYWPLGLDGPQRDARIERVTANLFQLGLGLPLPASLEQIGAPAMAPPDPFWAGSVRTIATGMPGPAGVAQLPDGSWVVADARAHRIWRIDASGNVAPYAGDGNPGGSGRYDNVPAAQARFFQPTAVLADASGNVYVADTHNCAIRKIANDASRTVSTVAGASMQADLRDGAGGAARFNGPMGLAWLDGTRILVADSANHAIRVIDLTTSTVTTLAGARGGEDRDGPLGTAVFFYPTAIARAADGRIFFVASSTGKLKVIGGGAVITLVQGGLGFADGPGTTARMLPQAGLAWDGEALLVADSGNQRIRRVLPGTSAATTRVQTWAGSGRVSGADGSGSAASFVLPLGMARGADGTVYVIDGGGSLRAVR